MGVALAPLVGRAEELALLDRRTRRGRARGVASCRAGGRTRHRQDPPAPRSSPVRPICRGAAGACQARRRSSRRDLPFWVFVNALDDYVRGLDPRLFDLLDGDVRAELAHVLPGLSDRPPAVLQPPSYERYRTHRSVRELLERLTATRPLVLMLDDLHWADPASVELLGGLLRRPPDAPVLLALAVRPEPGAAARSRRSSSVRTRAGTLVRIDARRADRGPRRTSSWGLDRRRGRLRRSTTRAAATRSTWSSWRGPWTVSRSTSRAVGAASHLGPRARVPPAVAATLAERAGSRSDSAQLVLQGAAVVGDPFEPELAAAAAGVAEPAALDGDRRAAEAELDPPDRRAAPVPLPTPAPAAGRLPDGSGRLAAERPRTGCGRPGAARERRPQSAPTTSSASGRKGDAHAVATLREAADATVHRAPETPARWYAAALRLLRDDAAADVRVELLLSRAGALASMRALRRGIRRPARVHRARPRRGGRAPGPPHHGVRRDGAPPRAGTTSRTDASRPRSRVWETPPHRTPWP